MLNWAFALILGSTLSYPLPTPELPCPQVTAVRILSRVGGEVSPTPDPKFAKVGEEVTLFAMVTASLGESSALYGVPAKFNASDGTVLPWPAECPIELAWFKVEAIPESYWNPRKFAAAKVEYVETPWKSGWTALADVHPTKMHDDFKDVQTGMGVMRFKVKLKTPQSEVASPGLECTESGAICRAVHFVTYRKDDTYLGYLYELFNTPYIYGSRTIKGGHQADLLVGSDCADFVVYGKRRQYGRKEFDYTCSTGLCRYGSECIRVKITEGFRYVDSKGETLEFGEGRRVCPGDAFVMDGGHVGVLVSDNGDGLLDSEDLMMHTLNREPEIVRIEECRWAFEAARIVKWKR